MPDIYTYLFPNEGDWGEFFSVWRQLDRKVRKQKPWKIGKSGLCSLDGLLLTSWRACPFTQNLNSKQNYLPNKLKRNCLKWFIHCKASGRYTDSMFKLTLSTKRIFSPGWHRLYSFDQIQFIDIEYYLAGYNRISHRSVYMTIHIALKGQLVHFLYNTYIVLCTHVFLIYTLLCSDNV